MSNSRLNDKAILSRLSVHMCGYRVKSGLNPTLTHTYARKAEISLIYTVGIMIVNREHVSCPIHLYDTARLMLNAHGRLAEAIPMTIPLTELRVQIRCGSVLLAAIAVLRTEQRQVYAGLCQFPVNVLKIWLNVKGRCNRPCWKQDIA